MECPRSTQEETYPASHNTLQHTCMQSSLPQPFRPTSLAMLQLVASTLSWPADSRREEPLTGQQHALMRAGKRWSAHEGWEEMERALELLKHHKALVSRPMLWADDVSHALAPIALHSDGDIRHACWHASQSKDGRDQGNVWGGPHIFACGMQYLPQSSQSGTVGKRETH